MKNANKLEKISSHTVCKCDGANDGAYAADDKSIVFINDGGGKINLLILKETMKGMTIMFPQLLWM